MSKDNNHRPTFYIAVSALWLLTGSTYFRCSSGTDPFSDNNKAPKASDSNVAVTQNVPFEGFMQASDDNGDPLVFEIVSLPGNGTVNVLDNATGRYRYTGLSAGADQFSFRASDGIAFSNTATVFVTISATAISLTEFIVPENLIPTGPAPAIDLEAKRKWRSERKACGDCGELLAIHGDPQQVGLTYFLSRDSSSDAVRLWFSIDDGKTVSLLAQLQVEMPETQAPALSSAGPDRSGQTSVEFIIGQRGYRLLHDPMVAWSSTSEQDK